MVDTQEDVEQGSQWKPDQEAELVRLQREKITQVLTSNNSDELLSSSLDTALAEARTGLKVDLACGASPRHGYMGVDMFTKEQLVASDPERTKNFDYDTYGYKQANLLEFPWPFEDNSIAAAYSSHFVEHIPHQVPGSDPWIDGWWLFFQELYRVMEDGGIVEIIHPFSRNDRAFWDPTHTRYIHFQTWFYLQMAQRKVLGVNHYAPEVDFEVMNIQTIHEPTYLQGKNDQVVDFVRQFYWNVTDDLFVVLKANK